MASPSSQGLNSEAELDLHPLYPNTAQFVPLLAPDSGLTPAQKAELVSHCTLRSCVFGDFSVLTFILTEPCTKQYVDLSFQDEDGTGLVTLTIQGFGTDLDRDIEREECIRLLVAHGADANLVDNAGWTALHHAALLAPPTLVSFLITNGCSMFSATRRNSTALDIVTAQSTIPGREGVALLLEEAMRGEGWSNRKKDTERKLANERMKRKGNQMTIRIEIEKALGVSPDWWGEDDSNAQSSDSETEEETDQSVFTPPLDFTTMLVFSPWSLPQILDSLITNFPPTFQNADPANALYMLARFACLNCDQIWMEDLIFGATDAIEATFYGRADDIACLIFWLYNATAWLHLMECDESINDTCEKMGFLEIIEEVINSVFVFIIRYVERRIDRFLDDALLDHTPADLDLEFVKFESDWSFFRPFTKMKAPSTSPSTAPSSPRRTPAPGSPNFQARPPSPSPMSHSRGLSSSIRQTFSRTRNSPSISTLNSLFADTAPSSSPADVTSFLTSFHSLLTISEINPAMTTQLWSQVMYWTSCELFNRILTRKKYLCRSKAMQISMNLGFLEEWVSETGLPRGIVSHFAPVRALLNWLQCLSSIADFSNLVETIQSIKTLNPLHMRRAVCDYKYEINEPKMCEECVQYLTQLQKDWERHRVKFGVEAMWKERDRERNHDGSVISSSTTDYAPSSASTEYGNMDISSLKPPNEQQAIDMLFERSNPSSTAWEPAKPPQALGELLDSRYMLPLYFPSDPRLLSASPINPWNSNNGTPKTAVNGRSHGRRKSHHLDWRSRNRKIRDISIDMLQWVDGIMSASRWGKPLLLEEDSDEGTDSPDKSSDDAKPDGGKDSFDADRIGVVRVTPLTRKPSARSRGRPSLSHGEEKDLDQS